MAVFNACEGIGFGMNEILAIIHEYVERNILFHMPMEPMIKQQSNHCCTIVRTTVDINCVWKVSSHLITFRMPQKSLYIPKVVKAEETFQT